MCECVCARSHVQTVAANHFGHSGAVYGITERAVAEQHCERAQEVPRYDSLSVVCVYVRLCAFAVLCILILTYARNVCASIAWFLRDAKRLETQRFLLADAEHRKLVTDVWVARHRDVPCPVTADSFGYNDTTKDLWTDLGFFADPSTYFTSLIVAQDLAAFVATRTSQWLGILDKLAATRKMAEKAKGAR